MIGMIFSFIFISFCLFFVGTCRIMRFGFIDSFFPAYKNLDSDGFERIFVQIESNETWLKRLSLMPSCKVKRVFPVAKVPCKA